MPSIQWFQSEEKEIKEEFESMIKNCIKDTFKTDIGENDYNRIHKVGPKITHKFTQLIVQF